MSISVRKQSDISIIPLLPLERYIQNQGKKEKKNISIAL